MLAQELNRIAALNVTGDLIIAPRFTMDFDGSSQRFGNYLYDTLDASEIRLSSTSEFNVNRMTPRAMMRIFRALRSEVAGCEFAPFSRLFLRPDGLRVAGALCVPLAHSVRRHVRRDDSTMAV